MQSDSSSHSITFPDSLASLLLNASSTGHELSRQLRKNAEGETKEEGEEEGEEEDYVSTI